MNKIEKVLAAKFLFPRKSWLDMLISKGIKQEA